MSLNQMNEQFNDAFETYFPRHRSPFKRFLYRAMSKALSVGFKLRTLLLSGRLLVNERIVEYPQIFRWIKPEGVVLDIGCVESRLPIQLASLGYKVHGIDVRPYPFKHPNFQFHMVDIFEWSPGQSFDVIILVSTLDHFGLGVFGDLKVENADKNAVERISNWLSEDGQLLVTLPFGKPEVTWLHRISDLNRLRYLFSDFEWVEQKYFKRVNESWIPCSAEELEEVASPELPGNGVALLNLRRIKGGL